MSPADTYYADTWDDMARSTLAGLGITLTPSEDPVAVLCQAMRLETGDAGALPEGWQRAENTSLYWRGGDYLTSPLCVTPGTASGGQGMWRLEHRTDGATGLSWHPCLLAAIRAAKETP